MQAFVENFYPERSRYAKLSVFEWFVKNAYLSGGVIGGAISGKLSAAFFLKPVTRMFAVDIDDHSGKGDGYLLSVYYSVIEKLGIKPSLANKTPRGIHAYYFLTDYYPTALITKRLKSFLSGIPVEVRPTCEDALRIPREDMLLDPDTLKPLSGNFSEPVEHARRYNPAVIFGEGLSPELLRQTLKEKKADYNSMRDIKKLSDMEAALYPVLTGMTNDALCSLVPLYRQAGCSAEEAMGRIISLLDEGYSGELRRERRLLQRINSFYKKTPDCIFTVLPAERKPDLFAERLAFSIADLVTGLADTPQQRTALTKKRNTVKKAVIYIEQWSVYIGGIMKNRPFAAVWDYLYPYFIKNVEKGFTPFPRNSWIKIHSNYERWLLPFLLEIGYLERSPYPYAPNFGICYYFRIEREKFLAVLPPEEPVAPKVNKADAHALQIRQYKAEHPKKSNREIAKELGYSHDTVNRALKRKLTLKEIVVNTSEGLLLSGTVFAVSELVSKCLTKAIIHFL